MIDDLRRLRTLREVAAQRSFSGAARALSYSQSSVSQQIAALERDLGLVLLDRGARPVEPTPAGRIVLRHAEELLGRAAAVERELEGLVAGERGSLRVGGFYTAWATFLPVAVAAYAREHPDVALELQQLEPEAAVGAVLAGELDLAVIYGFDDQAPVTEDPRLVRHRLLDDPYAIALPSGHPLATRSHLALADLAEERWVSPPAAAPYARLLHDLCRIHGGFAPHIAYETADIAMAQPLVAAGLAVAMLPALGLRPRHDGVVVRPLSPVPASRVVEICTLAETRMPTVPAMIAALRNAAGQGLVLG